MPSTGAASSGTAVLGQAGRDVRVMMLHLDQRAARSRARISTTGIRDADRRRSRSARDRTARCSARCRSGSRRRCARPPDRRYAATGSPHRPSPDRTWPSVRRRRQADPARLRTRAAAAMAAGAKPRARRRTRGTPAITRTTESSIRVAMARSCASTQSARPPSRASASSSSVICGSSVRLPLVITTGWSMSRSSSRCSGVVGSMKPSVLSPGATALGNASPVARSSTIGAAGPASSFASSADTAQ